MPTTPTDHPDARTHVSFAQVDHRPWPLPAGRWSWRQSWRDLLFAHWPVPAAAIRPLVPAVLELQEFAGTAWVAVVPFRMAGVMRRPLPDLPWVSAFPQVNVRVYVTAEGKPGVFFLSLDATNPLVAAIARGLFHVPYHWADIRMRWEGEWLSYECVRRGEGEKGGKGTGGERPAAVFRSRHRPTSEVYAAAPGTLEHFLTERYCLYALSRGGTVSRTEVHHAPWPLQRAEAEIEVNTMTAAGGLPVSGPPALLHFARRIDVVVWGAEKVG
ncbi:MAG: DUF2071 domain-containing protein [Anaerolineae bacterium]|nr:DUF2071 domain-containing protein [Anaerolineae bacterium]